MNTHMKYKSPITLNSKFMSKIIVLVRVLNLGQTLVPRSKIMVLNKKSCYKNLKSVLKL